MKSRVVQLEVMCEGYKREVTKTHRALHSLKNEVKGMRLEIAKKDATITKIGKAHKQYNLKR
jgi:hypothetical protein